jgi:hypothetical protein
MTIRDDYFAAAIPNGAVVGMFGFTYRYAEVHDTGIHFVIGGEGPS